jgi:hypothetical protein
MYGINGVLELLCSICAVADEGSCMDEQSIARMGVLQLEGCPGSQVT